MECLIVVDMEGITGITSEKQWQWKSHEWTKSRVLITNEVVSVIHGLDDSGVVNRVKIRDVHDHGFNILPQLLHPRDLELQNIKIINYFGGQGYRDPVLIGNMGPIESVIFVGAHASSGTPELGSHTFTRSLSNVKVNNRIVSEIHILSFLIQEYFNAKTAMVTGTPMAIRQVRNDLNTEYLLINPKIKVIENGIQSKNEMERHYEKIRNYAKQAILESINNSLVTEPWKKPLSIELIGNSIEITEKMFKIWNNKLPINYDEDRVISFESPTINDALCDLLSIALLTPNALKLMKLFPQIPKFSWWLQSKVKEPKINNLMSTPEFWIATNHENLNIEKWMISF